MRYDLEIPESIEKAYELWTKTKGTYLAAGTIILIDHSMEKKTLISLEKIPGLNRIEEVDSYIRIGANVTFDELENSLLIKNKAYALWQSACVIGGPQIRNRATIGGNVCCFSASADAVTPLFALGTLAVFFDGREYRQMPIEDLKPFENGEILTELLIPDSCEVSVFEKIGRRNALAVSQVNMALARDKGRLRVAVGSVGEEVLLCPKTAELVSLNKLEEAKAAILTEITPREASAPYKNLVCMNLLEKLYGEMIR